MAWLASRPWIGLCVAVLVMVVLVGVVLPWLVFRPWVSWTEVLIVLAGVLVGAFVSGVFLHMQVRRWWATATGIVVSLGAAALVGLPLAGAVMTLGGKGALERELDAWQAWGGPMMYEDVRPPSVPDDENAASAYMSAIEYLDATREVRVNAHADSENDADGSNIDPLDEIWDAAPEVLAKVLAQNRAALEKIQQGTSRTHARWSYDPHEVHERPSEGIHKLAQLLVAKAIVAIESDEPGKADQALEQVLILSEQIAAEPMLVELLVALSIQHEALHAVERLYRTRDDWPERFATQLDEVGLHSHLPRTLKGEAALGIEMFEEGFDGLAEQSVGLSSMRGYDRAYYLRSYREIIELAAEPRYLSREPLRVATDEMPWWTLTARILLPSLDHVFDVLARGEARLQMARIAIALREHKRVAGVYPDGLDELAIELTDPWDGKPMGYERLEAGFRLESRFNSFRAARGLTTWTWER